MNWRKFEIGFWKVVFWMLGLLAAIMLVGVFLRALDFSFWLANKPGF